MLLAQRLLDELIVSPAVEPVAPEGEGPTSALPPGPSLTETPAVLRALRRYPLGFLSSVARRYGSVVRLRFLFRDVLLVWQPDDVKHVLQDRHTIYTKESLDYRVLKRFLGEGLVTSDGAHWLRQRRLIQPAFHHRSIEAFAALMVERTLVLLESWERAIRERRPIDIQHDALGDSDPTVHDLPKLDGCTRALEESMRLYPPAWIITRVAKEADEISGYRVRPGTIVTLSPYVTHRSPEVWSDPETFDPDRFTPERSEGRPRFAYFPFAGGPRQCIGSEFALTEATLVLATIARRYRLELLPGRQVVPQPLITLRPRGGLPMIPRPAGPRRGSIPALARLSIP